jgi:hypothetical protein
MPTTENRHCTQRQLWDETSWAMSVWLDCGEIAKPKPPEKPLGNLTSEVSRITALLTTKSYHVVLDLLSEMDLGKDVSLPICQATSPEASTINGLIHTAVNRIT